MGILSERRVNSSLANGGTSSHRRTILTKRGRRRGCWKISTFTPRPNDPMTTREPLLEQVFCDDDPLNLVGALVDLGVLALTSTPSTDPVVFCKVVQSVFRFIDSSPKL